MATNDIYSCALEAILNGRPIVNTFALRWKDAGDPNSANFTTTLSYIAGLLAQNQVDDLTYVSWRATQIRGAGATYSTTPPFLTTTVAFSGSFSSAIAGALTSDPEPNNVAICVTVQTAQSGRRRKGRFFIGGISALWVDDNSMLNPTQLATLQTDLDTIEAAYKVGGGSTDGFEMGVYSMRIATNAKYVWTTSGPVLTSQGPTDPANAYMGMDSLVAQTFVASQRDRRPGL